MRQAGRRPRTAEARHPPGVQRRTRRETRGRPDAAACRDPRHSAGLARGRLPAMEFPAAHRHYRPPQAMAGARDRSRSSGACPTMPSGVAFTTKAWSARPATLASHSAMRSPGRSRASASARATGAVGHGHRRARIEQRRGDRARRAAGTEQQRWPCRGLHPMGVKIGHEAIAVGVAAGDLAVPKHQCVDRPAR